MRIEFLLCVVLLGHVQCLFTPVVRTNYGMLRGLRSVSGQNRYYGIPYATSERFQEPQEPSSWEGIRYAILRSGPCAQIIASSLTLGSEDCLRLDVYSPETAKPGQKLPVIVFLHGGAYYYGSKNHYDPEFLVTKNVVAVIINYRVGVFGFLCLNGVANLGLKDQVAALKWIRENIAAFGGDPDNVTLSGQSAGASAAAMHMLSEKSKGLFHKLILMSGNPFTPWAFNPEPMTAAFKDVAKRKIIPNEMLAFEFFANSTADAVHAVSSDTSRNPRYFKYSPCVDSNFTDPFFLDTPYNLIKSGRFNKVPILTGITNKEGLLFYGLNDEDSLKELDENFVQKLPSVFSWCSKRDRRKIAGKLRRHFFGSKRINMKLANNIMDFYSVWIANATARAFVNMMVQYSDQPVFNYVFTYEGERNFAKFLFGSRVSEEGASHSDDIFYVFKPAGLSTILNNRDNLFIDRLTTMLTNFMKFGNPTPFKSKLLPVRWPPVSATSLTMQLDDPPSLMRLPQTPHEQFYLDLLCSHGQEGYVPCDSAKKCSIN